MIKIKKCYMCSERPVKDTPFYGKGEYGCTNCGHTFTINPTGAYATPQPERVRILREAAHLTKGDRDVSYGDPFENHDNIALLFSAYLLGKYCGQTIDANQFALTAEDVAHFQSLTKIARTYASYKADNYVDGACYQAIAGECRKVLEDD